MGPAREHLWAVLLAAGASSRLGRPKQLVMLNGMALVRRAFEALTTVLGPRVLVVLGAEAAAVAAVVRAARLVHARHWDTGLSASIRAGLGALPADAAGALLASCDQYRLGAEDYERLAAAWALRPDHCVLARYGGVEGVPAILPRALFAPASRLTGDRGAAALLRRQPARLALDLPRAAEDLDTPADLERLAARSQTPKA